MVIADVHWYVKTMSWWKLKPVLIDYLYQQKPSTFYLATEKLAEIIVKSRNNEELTEIEEYRATMVIRRWLANMEWMFREMPLDSPERSYAEQSLTALSSEPLRRQVFEDNKNNFEANFVIWIENNIINQWVSAIGPG